MSRFLKRLALLAFLFAGPLSPAVGEVLWWMIDSNNKIEFDYVILKATQEGFYEDSKAIELDLLEGEGAEFSSGPFTTTEDAMSELGLTNPSSYNFFIELVRIEEGKNHQTVGVSEMASYGDLLDGYHIRPSDTQIPDNFVVWAPITYVPEPTSGLLLLVGVTLLSLRRRRNA